MKNPDFSAENLAVEIMIDDGQLSGLDALKKSRAVNAKILKRHFGENIIRKGKFTDYPFLFLYDFIRENPRLGDLNILSEFLEIPFST